MPQNPSTTPQMDNDVINLAKAIRQTESGGDFNAKGASEESGAYQWTPATWKAHAKQALGDENAEMTPSNQNAVAYTVLKSWKDQGLNPAQIAAKWNSGSETGWENKRGVNKFGVEYDVPKYVKSVTDAYQTVKTGGTPQMDANNPSSISGAQVVPPQPPQEEKQGFFESLARGIASPVATMLARPLQLGATLLGGSAEGIDKFSDKYSAGLVAPVPRNMGDVKEDVGRGLQTVAMGTPGLATSGALFGTGMSLEGGNDLLSAETAMSGTVGALGGKLLGFVGKPLLDASGKVIGKITPQIVKDVVSKGAGAVDDFMNQHKLLPDVISKPINKLLPSQSAVQKQAFEDSVNKTKQELYNIESGYAGMRNKRAFSNDEFAGSRDRITRAQVLNSAVNENGVILTKGRGGAAERYKNEYIKGSESAVRDGLEQEAASIRPEDLLSFFEKKLGGNRLLVGDARKRALAKVKAEIAGYRKNPDGSIPLTELHDAKIATTEIIKDFATPAGTKTYQKSLAKALKEIIEDRSQLNVKEVNEELAKYYKDIDYLESLDGKRVKGGKLGKYFAQIAGNIVGGSVGTAVGGAGGGIAGTILGGEVASGIKAKLMQGALKTRSGAMPAQSEILKRGLVSSRKLLPAPKEGAYRSEKYSGGAIPIPPKLQSRVELNEASNPNIGTTAKGYSSTGKIKIKGIDKEGNLIIEDKGNILVIPADDLPVIK